MCTLNQSHKMSGMKRHFSDSLGSPQIASHKSLSWMVNFTHTLERKKRNIPGHFLNRFDRFGSLVRAECLLIIF